MDPGPWTFGELLQIIEGRQIAHLGQAVEIWKLAFGDGPQKAKIVRGEQAELVWAQASRFLKKRKE